MWPTTLRRYFCGGGRAGRPSPLGLLPLGWSSRSLRGSAACERVFSLLKQMFGEQQVLYYTEYAYKYVHVYRYLLFYCIVIGWGSLRLHTGRPHDQVQRSHGPLRHRDESGALSPTGCSVSGRQAIFMMGGRNYCDNIACNK